jgi:L-asparaginase II
LTATSALPGSVPGHAPLLATTRGFAGRETVECVHAGSIAIVDRDGRLVAGAGDPEALNFTRSTLKPLQALPFVEDGGMARFSFGSQDLAVMCSSHSGEGMHVDRVRAILRRIGAQPSDLGCGAHAPRYFEALGLPCPPRVGAHVLFHNCSGKHSGFLAYCRMHGHRLEGYLEMDGALQTRIRNTVRRFAGSDPIAAGTDGCNAPNFALPLQRLASLYGRIACDDDPSLQALYYAMTRHPDLVSGTGRSDLAIMQAGKGDWVSKVGADGMQAIGVRSLGLGIAVRIGGGSAWAARTAAVEVLHQIGLLDEPQRSPLWSYFRPEQRNARGARTGSCIALFALPRLVA